MSNKVVLLNKKVKSHLIIYLIIFIFFLTLTSLSYFIKTYDLLNVTGISECEEMCTINFSFPYSNVNVLEYDDLRLIYMDEIYEIKEIIYSEPYLNNGVPFQDIELVTSISGESEKIINFRLLYNKQRIIEKLKNVIVEGEWLVSLSNDELREIEGGGLKISAAGIGLIVGGVVSFAIGVVNGFLRPLACTK